MRFFCEKIYCWLEKLFTNVLGTEIIIVYFKKPFLCYAKKISKKVNTIFRMPIDWFWTTLRDPLSRKVK